MVEVVTTDEFASWYLALDVQATRAVDHCVGLLADRGVTLGFPFSSAIEGATFGLRELRVQAGGRPLRVFYAFDPERAAVLILGGDKTGDARFYESSITSCERIWREYLEERRQ
jgi:hypothetical protein